MFTGMALPLVPTVHRFTREEYYALGESGILAPPLRTELLEGEIVEMSPQLSRHASVVNALTYALIAQTGAKAIVRTQTPIVLDDTSEPEPDIALCRTSPDRYFGAHPLPADVLLVIEVADTSLEFDLRRKVPAYAAAGILECWVVDLPGDRVHVFSGPDRAARSYSATRIARRGDVLALPGGESLAASDVLPPV